MKHFALLALTLFVLGIALPAHAISNNPPGDLEAAKRLRASADQLRTAHDKLQAMRDEVENVRHVSTVNFQNNAYKVFMKGIIDLHNRVSAPGGWVDVVCLALETVQNIWIDPALYGSMVQETNSKERATLSNATKNSLQASGRVQRYVYDLAQIMGAPLSRFDDDQLPLRSSKAWWRHPGDGVTDDAIELTTRKLLIVKNLSGKMVEVMDRELASLRSQRKTLLEVATSLENQAADPKAKPTGKGNRAYLEALMPDVTAVIMPPSAQPDREPEKAWSVSTTKCNGCTFPHYNPQDKYTGLEELTWSYGARIDWPNAPEVAYYDYDLYVTIKRGDAKAIRSMIQENIAFVRDMLASGQMNDYSGVNDFSVGDGGYSMPATSEGGMNHTVIFFKDDILVEIKTSPWPEGLDIAKSAARAVAAKIK